MRADSLASSSTSLIDRGLPNRFAAEVAGRGEVCDMGCGPGHVARYLRDIGTTVFGLDFSPRMVEQARQLNPDISFRQGNMLALRHSGSHARRDCPFLCHRQYSQRISAVSVSGNGEGEVLPKFGQVSKV